MNNGLADGDLKGRKRIYRRREHLPQLATGALQGSRYQQEGKPEVLVNVEMLTEGFDAPHTGTVFIARPTQSEVLVTQMIGRASRGTKANGNDNGLPGHVPRYVASFQCARSPVCPG